MTDFQFDFVNAITLIGLGIIITWKTFSAAPPQTFAAILGIFVIFFGIKAFIDIGK